MSSDAEREGAGQPDAEYATHVGPGWYFPDGDCEECGAVTEVVHYSQMRPDRSVWRCDDCLPSWSMTIAEMLFDYYGVDVDGAVENRVDSVFYAECNGGQESDCPWFGEYRTQEEAEEALRDHVDDTGHSVSIRREVVGSSRSTDAPSSEEPDYYGKREIEPIDFIESLDDKPFHFHVGNIIKYLSRFDEKNGVEDLKKARWYLNRLIGRVDGAVENRVDSVQNSAVAEKGESLPDGREPEESGCRVGSARSTDAPAEDERDAVAVYFTGAARDIRDGRLLRADIRAKAGVERLEDVIRGDADAPDASTDDATAERMGEALDNRTEDLDELVRPEDIDVDSSDIEVSLGESGVGGPEPAAHICPECGSPCEKDPTRVLRCPRCSSLLPNSYAEMGEPLFTGEQVATLMENLVCDESRVVFICQTCRKTQDTGKRCEACNGEVEERFVVPADKIENKAARFRERAAEHGRGDEA